MSTENRIETQLIEALLGTCRTVDYEGRPCWCVGEYVGQRHVDGRPHDADCLQARAALSSVRWTASKSGRRRSRSGRPTSPGRATEET